jgi:hypothetical protein
MNIQEHYDKHFEKIDKLVVEKPEIHERFRAQHSPQYFNDDWTIETSINSTRVVFTLDIVRSLVYISKVQQKAYGDTVKTGLGGYFIPLLGDKEKLSMKILTYSPKIQLTLFRNIDQPFVVAPANADVATAMLYMRQRQKELWKDWVKPEIVPVHAF